VSIEEFPIVDTTNLDKFVSDYFLIQQIMSPAALLEVLSNGQTVEEELFGLIRAAAMTDLAGLAVLASSMFAIGLDEADQTTPSMVGVGDECTFTGRISDVVMLDFNEAVDRADLAPVNRNTGLMPGLLFSTETLLVGEKADLGYLSLARYCAILPGSLYEIREIPYPFLLQAS
jgi:hypothetical protein